MECTATYEIYNAAFSANYVAPEVEDHNDYGGYGPGWEAANAAGQAAVMAHQEQHGCAFEWERTRCAA